MEAQQPQVHRTGSPKEGVREPSSVVAKHDRELGGRAPVLIGRGHASRERVPIQTERGLSWIELRVCGVAEPLGPVDLVWKSSIRVSQSAGRAVGHQVEGGVLRDEQERRH